MWFINWIASKRRRSFVRSEIWNAVEEWGISGEQVRCLEKKGISLGEASRILEEKNVRSGLWERLVQICSLLPM